MTISYGRPGVYVRETPLPVQIPDRSSGPAVATIIGWTPEGPTVPTLLSTWSDYTRVFNVVDVNSPMHRSVYQVFTNGGGPVYVLRVAPSDATVATLSNDDLKWSPFQINAISSGEWGNTLFVTFEEEPRLMQDDPITWSVTVERASGRQNFSPLVFRNLSTNPNDGNYFANRINQASNNFWIYAVPGSEKEAAGFLTLTYGRIDWLGKYRLDISGGEVSRSRMRLRGGSNGTLSAVAGLGGLPNAAEYTNDLDALSPITRSLLLYCADAAYMDEGRSRQINTALALYATNRQDSFAILDTPQGMSPSTAVTHSGLATTFAAMFYPWIRTSNPARDAPPGTTLLVPPGAAVTGAFVTVDRSSGPWNTPAGTNLVGTVSTSLGLGVERSMTTDELDMLNTAATPVNPVRSVLGRGVVIMGARTQRNLDMARYISVRRSLNYFKKELEVRCESALFQPITISLMQGLESSLSAWLTSKWADSGALAGATPAEAFYVTCDRTNNPPEDSAEGRLNVDVGLSLLIPAEYIVLRVGQFQGSTTVSETFSDQPTF